MGGQSRRPWWRSQNARALAQPWRSTKREVSSGLVSGAGGGFWTAAVTPLPWGWCVAIGLVIAVAGAFTPWLIVYIFGLFTATGRDARSRLSEIEAQLSLAKMAPDDSHEDIRKFRIALATGQLLRQRCPQASRTEGSLEFNLEVDQWVEDVTELLNPWPQFQKQFSGELNLSSRTGRPLVSQILDERIGLLVTILKAIIIPNKVAT